MFLRRDLGCREVLPKPFYFRLHVEMDFYEACVALVIETVRTLPALVDGARSYLLLRMEEDIIQRALSGALLSAALGGCHSARHCSDTSRQFPGSPLRPNHCGLRR